MGSRASLNKVLLIGNLTRDPELRYTPSGAAVCTFGLATNRTYVASDGTRREETEFMRIVSWNKLAELCSQLLTKGRKVYVEGRLQTRSWETPDGQSRQTTEVVIDDMRILDSRRDFVAGGDEETAVAPEGEQSQAVKPQEPEAPKEASETSEAAQGKDQARGRVQKAAGTATVGLRKSTKATKAQEPLGSPDEDKDDLDDLPF